MGITRLLVMMATVTFFASLMKRGSLLLLAIGMPLILFFIFFKKSPQNTLSKPINWASAMAKLQPPASASPNSPPKVDEKITKILERCRDDNWPNEELRALIECSKSDVAVRDLWARKPLSKEDYAILSAYSKDPAEQLLAAEQWAQLDPKNSAPLMRIAFLNRKKVDFLELLNYCQEVLPGKKFDVYSDVRTMWYDSTMRKAGLDKDPFLTKIENDSTRPLSLGLINFFFLESQKAQSMTDEKVDKLASVSAMLGLQIRNSPWVSTSELNNTLVTELSILKNIPGGVEYGAGLTVGEQIANLQKELDTFNQQQHMCKEAFSSDPAFFEEFETRSKSIGRAKAYKLMSQRIQKLN